MNKLPIELDPSALSELAAEYGPIVLIMLGAFFLVKYISQVGPRRARALETFRGLLFRKLHPLDGKVGLQIPPVGQSRDLLRDKTDSGEHVLTTEESQRAVENALFKNGWAWNPISTKKYRVVDGEKQYTVGTWVYRANRLADTQLHCYLFRNDDGTIDVYCHQEPNLVTNPTAHVHGSNQVAGDPNGRLQADLTDSGVEFVPAE